MRDFIATYHSPGNLEKGEIHIRAIDLTNAQDKFFDFLKTTNVYPHMWKLNLEIKEIDNSI